jgi:tetrahydromethanopterin S-methyltransferase subunit G
MQTQQFKSLGFNFNLAVPETAEEFDQLAGKSGACVDEATRNVVYRQANHDFRKAFCEAVENETGIPRETKTVKNAKGEEREVFDEKEQEYINRVQIAKDENDEPVTNEEKLQVIASQVGKDIKFDPTPSERKKKAPKEIEENAKGILANIEAGNTKAATVASKFGEALGCDFATVYGEVTEESLVQALLAVKAKEDRDRTNRFC